MIIPELLKFFAGRFAAENGRERPEFTPEALAALQELPWPGNIRQLRNCVESMVVLSPDGKLDVKDIPDRVRGGSISHRPETTSLDIRASERELIERALAECGGNRTRAAEKLGISRRTLLRKLSAKE